MRREMQDAERELARLGRLPGYYWLRGEEDDAERCPRCRSPLDYVVHGGDVEELVGEQCRVGCYAKVYAY